MTVLPRTSVMVVVFGLAASCRVPLEARVRVPADIQQDPEDTASTGETGGGGETATTAETGGTTVPVVDLQGCVRPAPLPPSGLGRRLEGTLTTSDAWWSTYGTMPDGYLGANGGVGDFDGDGHADLAVSHVKVDPGVSVFFGPLAQGSFPEPVAASYSVVGTPDFGAWSWGLTDVDCDGITELLFYSHESLSSTWEILDLYQGPVGKVETSAFVAQATLDLTSWGHAWVLDMHWSSASDVDADGHPDMWLTTADGPLGEWFLKLLPGPMVGARDPQLESIAAYFLSSPSEYTYQPMVGPDQDVLAVGAFDGDDVPDVAFGFRASLGSAGGVAWVLDPPLVVAAVTDVITSEVHGSADSRYLGQTHGVLAVPDMDGDGYDETAFSGNGSVWAGSGGIFLMQYGPPPAGLFTEDDLSLTILDADPNAWGEEMFTGDFDGDGVSDIVAQDTQTWLFYGPVPTGALSVDDADAIMSGVPIGVADFDADGFDDLAFTVLGAAGEAYVLLGGWL